MAPRLVAFAMTFAVLLYGSTAIASGRVLLLESPSSTPGLRDALRIQLPHGTELAVEPFDLGGTVAVRVRVARERLIQQGGRMALWVEEWSRTEAEREVVVYFVARSGDRALIEIVRVRGHADDELERLIALKGVVVLEALDQNEDGAVTGAMLGTKRDATPSDSTSSHAKAAPVFQLGGLGAASGTVHFQGIAEAGAGLVVRTGRARIEGLGIARLSTPLSAQSPAGILRAFETYVGGSGRGVYSLGDLAVGVFLDAGARLLDVEGTTAAGTPGSSQRSLPTLAFGPEVRLELVPWLELRGALGADVMLRRQRFAVNEQAFLDLGASRGLFALGLVASAW